MHTIPNIAEQRAIATAEIAENGNVAQDGETSEVEKLDKIRNSDNIVEANYEGCDLESMMTTGMVTCSGLRNKVCSPQEKYRSESGENSADLLSIVVLAGLV